MRWRRKVAVKVQHRDIEPVMLQDLRQCDVLSAVLAWLEPTFDFRPLLREVNAEHRKELDFRAEAANLNQARSYRDRVEIALADFMALRLVAQIAVASVARRPFTSRAAGAVQP